MKKAVRRRKELKRISSISVEKRTKAEKSYLDRAASSAINAIFNRPFNPLNIPGLIHSFNPEKGTSDSYDGKGNLISSQELPLKQNQP